MIDSGNREGERAGVTGGAAGVTGGADGATGGAAEDEGPVGIFPSWGWVYGTVLVYGGAMILFLWVLTRLLDPGVGP